MLALQATSKAVHASVLAKAKSKERLGEEEGGRLLKWKIACVTSAWWNSYGTYWESLSDGKIRPKWREEADTAKIAGRKINGGKKIFLRGENGGKKIKIQIQRSNINLVQL